MDKDKVLLIYIYTYTHTYTYMLYTHTHIPTMEYYSAKKRKKFCLLQTWINLEVIVLSKISQRKKMLRVFTYM